MARDVRALVVEGAELVVSVAAIAGLGELAVLLADAPQWILVPATAGIGAAKAWLATFVGDRSSTRFDRKPSDVG